MTSLIDRYIAATNDGFPGGDQTEVEREVRVALNDIVEARMDQGMSREEAERAAVEELGDPKVFAEQFRGKQRYLVGPKLFSSWWLIIRTLLLVVTPIIMAIAAIETLAQSDPDLGQVIGESIGTGFNFAIHAFFWVTVTYFIVERVGITPEMEGSLVPKSDWSIEDLPELDTGRQVGKWELILQVVPISLMVWFVSRLATEGMSTVGLHHLLDLPADLAVFNPDLSAIWFWGLVGLVVVNVLVAVWSFMVGYWTQTVTMANILLNLAWIAFIVALASTGDILNPEILVLRSDEGEWSLVGENANDVIVGIFVIISVWEIWDSISGHLKFRRQTRSA